MAEPPSNTRKSFLLRINPRLWEELEAWAQEDLRSINGQIEFLLKQAVEKRRKEGLKTQNLSAKPET